MSSRPTGFSRHIPRAHPLSWVMLIVTTLAVLMIAIDRMLLPTVMPAILDDFHLTTTQGGILIGLSYAGTVVGGLLLGMFGDAFGKGPGRAWGWLVAVFVASISAVITAFTSSLAALRVLRVTMGIGTGGMEPVNVTMVGEWWQREDRGFAVGAHHTGFPFGQFLGPVLIGAVIAAASWREVFLFLPLIAIPIAVLQIILARPKNLERVNRWIRAHDMTPSVETVRREKLHVGERVRGMFRSAAEALKTRNVFLAVILNFIFLFTETSIISFLTLQLTRDVGVPLSTAAIIAGASGITGWIGQIVWGAASDHTGRKSSLKILTVGMAITIAAMVFIHSVALAWIILLCWGLVRNSPYPVMYASIIDAVPEGASSGLGLMIGVGLGASGVVAGPIAGMIVGNLGFVWHYLFLAALCLLALIPISFITDPTKDKKMQEAYR
ncbi:MFS transporter [Spelaeicoccus albus]|uniref:MFS family permease n=1 Tax=Spelaeicoccus albus TaxID=1280376 RepID=A0A7Z0A9Z7_9MICO|nr:MFS transporter [Spelaeicoccus albus]NYI67144.1 MFS family permease [Spelaeicoccus albus]